jgi:heme exporter protein A
MQSSPAPVVEAAALVRSFGARRAIAGVSLSLLAGECLCIFGPNGAGKTTLLRVFAGILRPTAGQARIGGVALPGGSKARARAGYTAHGSMLYGALTSLENVEFAARMYGIRNATEAAAAALDRIGARKHAHTPVRLLSRGQQQRISIARALVHSPEVLLLDEPFSGLDESGSRTLAALLASLRESGVSMIIVTHNIPDGLSLATHCGIMIDGAFAHFERRDRIDAARYTSLYHELVTHGE